MAGGHCPFVVWLLSLDMLVICNRDRCYLNYSFYRAVIIGGIGVENSRLAQIVKSLDPRWARERQEDCNAG